MGAETKKVILAKMGLDAHDTGIVQVSHALKQAGMEVVYLGLHNTAAQIVESALEEDADIVGLSFLSGEHLPNTAKFMKLAREKGLAAKVTVGGIIPKDDYTELKKMGVSEIFGPGTPLSAIADQISA